MRSFRSCVWHCCSPRPPGSRRRSCCRCSRSSRTTRRRSASRVSRSELLLTTLTARGQQPGFAPARLRVHVRRRLVGVRLLRGSHRSPVYGRRDRGGAQRLEPARARRAVPVAFARAAALAPRSVGAVARAARLAHAARAVTFPGARALRVRHGSRRSGSGGSSSWRRAARGGSRSPSRLPLALLVGIDLHVESRAWQRAAQGPPIAERDHRPQPVAFGIAGGDPRRARRVQPQPARLSRPVAGVGAGRLPLALGKIARRMAARRRAREQSLWQALRRGSGRGEPDRDDAIGPRICAAGLVVFAATVIVFFAQLVLRRRRAF